VVELVRVMRMKISVRAFAAACLLMAMTAVGQADAAFTIKEKHFAVSGSTGLELYESIGRNGPGNAIAHTSYAMQWFKKFNEEGGGCRLLRARPVVTITYTLPKPSGKLAPVLRKRWDAFIVGVRKHEEEHGRMIREMIAQAETSIAGAYVADDLSCRKAKRAVLDRVEKIALTYKERSRAFDRVEQSNGGNVHRLILALVDER
jgi:predicted secreted Zn-dependent protease